MSDQSTDPLRHLEALIPQSVELVIDGEALSITPLRVGQMPAFLRAIRPVMEQLSAHEIDWLSLLGEHGDALLTAMSVAVGRPRAWIDALAADEAILLASKVIEVNADFFVRTVIPRLATLGTVLQSPAAMATGSTPSST